MVICISLFMELFIFINGKESMHPQLIILGKGKYLFLFILLRTFGELRRVKVDDIKALKRKRTNKYSYFRKEKSFV